MLLLKYQTLVQNENDMNLSSEFDEVCVTKAKENTANESADDVKADEFYEWFTRELFDIEKENDVKKEFELNDDPHYKQVFDGACCNDKVDANKDHPPPADYLCYRYQNSSYEVRGDCSTTQV